MERAPALIPAAGVVAGIALGHFVQLACCTPGASSTTARHVVELRGAVVESEARPPGSRCTLRLDDGRLVQVSLRMAAPAVGERLDIAGELEPFDDARNPGEPSQRELEAERGVVARVIHARVVARTPPNPRDVTLWVPRLRAWAAATVRAEIAEPEATILVGALWGEKGTLPADLHDAFQATGTMHVLVTAGLHLGAVAALAALVLRGFGCGRVAWCLGTIAVVWCYAAFSGAHLPSLRAATMATVWLAARALGRVTSSWNALAIAALGVALLWPAAVTTLSFALSFSCVAAIVLFAKPIARLAERAGVPAIAHEGVALSLATQLGTWPLTAAAFLVFAPYAPLANLLVVPLIALVIPVGVGLLLATPIAPLAHLFAALETTLLGWIVGIVQFVAALPFARIPMTPPPVWSIALYDAAIITAVAWMWPRGRRLAAIACVGAATACALWPVRGDSGALIVRMIDVGQGEAIAIRTPGGHALLVDAGGIPERGPTVATTSAVESVGDRRVVPALLRMGIHRLDAIVMTHPHGDHVGGVAPVIRRLGAAVLADGGQPYGAYPYRQALAAATEFGVRIVHPRAGTIWRSDDGVTIRFYGPAQPYFAAGARAVDENSLVFLLTYGNVRMLFTGDAGEQEEARLLQAGVDLRADVLKVGHHGSRFASSAAFLDA
ncbi:MAG: ComEC/Rec2 family competence protein, partial [Vulcanimicrobiaceae bacterium]